MLDRPIFERTLNVLDRNRHVMIPFLMSCTSCIEFAYLLSSHERVRWAGFLTIVLDSELQVLNLSSQLVRLFLQATNLIMELRSQDSDLVLNFP